MSSSNSKANEGVKTPPVLYPAVPVDWLWLPRPIRKAVGWITVVLFALSFFTPIFALLLLIPAVWKAAPLTAGLFLVTLVLSFLVPPREWVAFRKVGQLWYEIFQFSCNVSPQEAVERMKYADQHQLILAMHPHGIVPFQAILWSAYCDQIFRIGDHSMYGFGAAADVVQYVPILRNFLFWLSAGSASYNVLRDGLVEGKSAAVNAAGRKPKHLYILPGGVAEIFLSKPGKTVSLVWALFSLPSIPPHLLPSLLSSFRYECNFREAHWSHASLL